MAEQRGRHDDGVIKEDHSYQGKHDQRKRTQINALRPFPVGKITESARKSTCGAGEAG